MLHALGVAALVLLVFGSVAFLLLVGALDLVRHLLAAQEAPSNPGAPQRDRKVV